MAASCRHVWLITLDTDHLSAAKCERCCAAVGVVSGQLAEGLHMVGAKVLDYGRLGLSVEELGEIAELLAARVDHRPGSARASGVRRRRRRSPARAA